MDVVQEPFSLVEVFPEHAPVLTLQVPPVMHAVAMQLSEGVVHVTF